MPDALPDPPLDILIAASEAVPFAKTGGLADVVGALSVELARLGHRVQLVVPRYSLMDRGEFATEEFARLLVPTPPGPVEAVIDRLVESPSTRQMAGSLSVYMVRYDRFFGRAGLYQEAGKDYPDNLDRFSFFSRAVMELILLLDRQCGWRPSVMHLHDWQTALCAILLKTLYALYPSFKGVRSVLTLHNIGYQGIFPESEYEKIGLPAKLFSSSFLEYFGSINLLKGGIVFADFLTTVSPTYSREIQGPEFGFGLQGVLAERKNVLRGILNGIDMEAWNPETDRFLSHHYSVSALEGKRHCKRQLQAELHLPESNVLVVGLIARLAEQKGLDLVLDLVPQMMELDLQLVILGTGDQTYTERFTAFSQKYPDRLAFRNAFDEALAHRIEAGSDLFLMPSRYEPCGLNQLYSLRYGTVPLVRKTGGLADSVIPYTPLNMKHGRATGFVFTEATSDTLLPVLLLAVEVYGKPSVWRLLMTKGMSIDSSWRRSALAYVDIFREVMSAKAANPLTIL